MKHWLMSLVLILAVLGQTTAAKEGFDHTAWDALLKQHVRVLQDGKITQVDYQGFTEQRSALKAYLAALSAVDKVEFDAFSKDEQLAFLINAYNAWTVELILTEWPELDSIKDLGSLFRSPWSKDIASLFGKQVTLDNIEHDMIRGSDRYQEPRIHFAVNCASIGCPALRAEAYQGELLDWQLEQQTRLFLADKTRNRLVEDELQLSSIFKWYKQDFAKGWLGYDSLEKFLLAYKDALSLTPQAVQALQDGEMDITYLDYDWGLNRTP
ncbi:DUF547 domain-containing protein [Marinomonas sp. THO17]|uniref:DUF547 domain-containing protein n=1 Tax=Marinomonas sp. THO17 TaxID=3149048 RepID=UPI00336C1F0D